MTRQRKQNLTIRERLERDRIYIGECWETTLDPNKKYPSMKLAQGVKLPFHRASYEEYIGPIPSGMSVLHHCDNPRCHRPTHLFLGTYSDNMYDMWNKGRHPVRARCVNPQQVASLHEGRSQLEVAAILGVSQGTISNILRELGISRGRETSFRKASRHNT